MTVPIKQLAELRIDTTLMRPAALLTLDRIESGTGRLVASGGSDTALPPEVGVAYAQPGDVLFGKLRPYLAKVFRTWLAGRVRVIGHNGWPVTG